MDTFPAWLVERLTRGLTRRGCEPTVTGLADVYGPLIDEVRHVLADSTLLGSERHALVYALDQVGRTITFIGGCNSSPSCACLARLQIWDPRGGQTVDLPLHVDRAPHGPRVGLPAWPIIAADHT